MTNKLTLADTLRTWLAAALRRLALRVEGNDPDAYEHVLIHVDDLPGWWIRERHAEDDWALYRAMDAEC